MARLAVAVYVAGTALHLLLLFRDAQGGAAAGGAVAWLAISLLVFAIVSLETGSQLLSHPLERRFWRDVSLGLGLRLAAELMAVFVPAEASLALGGEMLHAASYGLWALALARRPEMRHRWRPEALERSLTWPQVTLFVCAVTSYFVLLPRLFAASPSQPSGRLALDVVLGVYLAWRSFRLSRTADTQRWRPFYTLVALAFVAVVSRSLLARPDAGPGLAGDLVAAFLTPLPWLLLVVVARLRRILPPPETASLREKIRRAESSPEPVEETLASALFLVFAHFAVATFGSVPADGALRAFREISVFGWLLLFAALALVQEHFWRKGAARLRRQMRRTRRSLNRLESKLNLKLRRQESSTDRLHEEDFAEIFDSSPEMIAVTRMRDGRILAVNRACREALGYTPQQLLGQKPQKIGLWTRERDRIEMLRLLSEHGTVRNLDVVLRKRSGTVLNGRLSARLVELDRETCVIAVLRTGGPIDASLRGLDSLLDSAQAAVSLVDPEGRLLYCNRSAERLFGRSTEELIGRRPRNLFGLPSADWTDGRHTLKAGGRKVLVENRSSLVSGLGGWGDSRLILSHPTGEDDAESATGMAGRASGATGMARRASGATGAA